MFNACGLTKDQKTFYYSLIDAIGIKDIKSGNISHAPDVSKLQYRMDEHAIQSMVADELGYHFKLLKVPSKPYIVYTKGNIDILDLPLLGIVGPRKPSMYAQHIMQDFFAVLKNYHVATVSGGAPGIDTLCYDLSLQHNIPTVVVMGGGLAHYLQKSRTHPIHHDKDTHLFLSEFKLKQTPTSYTFPQRNRIIAGLSDILFVPAAGKKSGSLITVDFALQIHTTAYTVPASIHEVTSAGSNAYLAEENMKAVVDYEAMLDKHFEKKEQTTVKSRVYDLTPEQMILFSYLQEHGPQSVDTLAIHMHTTPSVILADITILEIQGCIREEKPGYYTVL